LTNNSEKADSGSCSPFLFAAGKIAHYSDSHGLAVTVETSVKIRAIRGKKD
jgi:hypothetical protein